MEKYKSFDELNNRFKRINGCSIEEYIKDSSVVEILKKMAHDIKQNNEYEERIIRGDMCDFNILFDYINTIQQSKNNKVEIVLNIWEECFDIFYCWVRTKGYRVDWNDSPYIIVYK